MTEANNFFTRIEKRANAINSLLCVGLDPHLNELKLDNASISTEEEKCDAAYSFCKTIILSTYEYTVAYKPNAAFFEALGPNLGISTLKRVVDFIKEIDDEIQILFDCKRGDIGSTAQAYAESSYHLQSDAVTLSPLMGWDSVQPFVVGKYISKGAFLLCKTSNPGSNDLLTINVKQDNDISFLYEKIAKLANEWSTSTGAGLGLVVGATDTEALRRARAAAGDEMWILSPGVGFQGGDLEGTLEAALNSKGSGILMPISRGISRANDIAAKAKEYRDAINLAREATLQKQKQSSIIPADEESLEVLEYQREFIEFALDLGVLKFGSFVLKSGRTSPYFFNAGLFSTGQSLHKLGLAYADSIMNYFGSNGKDLHFDVIFGPAYKGISLGAVVASALFDKYGVNVGFAYNRKEAKDHGEGGSLVGANMKNKNVLIVDDVISAGTAIRESFTLLKQTGAIPVAVSIALDRAEKRALDDPISAVQSVMRDLKIPVISIVSLPQLQGFLSKHEKYGEEVLQNVATYREQYGV